MRGRRAGWASGVVGERFFVEGVVGWVAHCCLLERVSRVSESLSGSWDETRRGERVRRSRGTRKTRQTMYDGITSNSMYGSRRTAEVKLDGEVGGEATAQFLRVRIAHLRAA